MNEKLLAKLKEIDAETLTEIVRRDQHSPSFMITDWTVQRLSDKGVINPDGLWLFSGTGNDRECSRPWSVVLKVFHHPEAESPPSDLWYWKRELRFAQSGLAERLPGPVRAPRFYKVEEDADGAWLWMEHVKNQQPTPWALEDYAFAARQLGAWNGKYVWV